MCEPVPPITAQISALLSHFCILSLWLTLRVLCSARRVSAFSLMTGFLLRRMKDFLNWSCVKGWSWPVSDTPPSFRPFIIAPISSTGGATGWDRRDEETRRERGGGMSGRLVKWMVAGAFDSQGTKGSGVLIPCFLRLAHNTTNCNLVVPNIRFVVEVSAAQSARSNQLFPMNALFIVELIK